MRFRRNDATIEAPFFFFKYAWCGATLVLSLLIAGCAGPVRTVSMSSAPDEHQIYPMTQAQADAVLLRAMLKTFPDAEVERAQVPAPAVRYQARLRFALDSHVVVATALPASRRDGAGSLAEGYAFQVSDSGSMPMSGSSRAERLFSELRAELAASDGRHSSVGPIE